MPNRRGKPGDLYAEVKIMVPGKPTERERKLFEQLAAESTFDPRRGR
jgi:curved DNA-binding protein